MKTLSKWLAVGAIGIALAILCSTMAADAPSLSADDPADTQACVTVLDKTPPDVGKVTVESLEMRVRWQGHSLSSYHSPNEVVGTDDGKVLAIFDWRSGWPLEEIILYWNGYRLGEPIEPPTPSGCDSKSKTCQGHIYHVHIQIDALGDYDVGIFTERQVWWKGQKLDFGPLTTGYFNPDICGGLTYTYLVTDESTELICGTTYYGGTDGPE